MTILFKEIPFEVRESVSEGEFQKRVDCLDWNKDYEKIPFKEKKVLFVDWLIHHSNQNLWKVKRESWRNERGFKIDWVTWNHPISIYYLSPEGILSDALFFDTYRQNISNINTREVQPTELIIEFDCEQEKAFRFIADVYYKLIELGYNFFVWYAEGQRCPHIRIYDFLDDNLTIEQQEFQRKVFVANLCSEESLPFLDKSLLITGKTCQLEFAKHWRYDTMFKRVLEAKQ